MSKKDISGQSATHPWKKKKKPYMIYKIYDPIFWIDWKSKIIGNAWSLEILESSVDKPPFKQMEMSEIKLGPIWDRRSIMIPLQLKQNISRLGVFLGGLDQKYKAVFCVFLRNAKKKGTRIMGFL